MPSAPQSLRVQSSARGAARVRPGHQTAADAFIRRLALRHRLTKLPRKARDLRHCTCGRTLTLTIAMGSLEPAPLDWLDWVIDWVSFSLHTEWSLRFRNSAGQLLRATHALVRHGHRAASPAGALCGWCRCSVAFQPGAITRHLVLHLVLAILPFPTSSTTQNLGAARFFAQTSDPRLTLCQPGPIVTKITLCFEAGSTTPILRANVTSVWGPTQLGVHVD